MSKFRKDNTQGFNDSELAIMNEAFGYLSLQEDSNKRICDTIKNVWNPEIMKSANPEIKLITLVQMAWGY